MKLKTEREAVIDSTTYKIKPCPPHLLPMLTYADSISQTAKTLEELNKATEELRNIYRQVIEACVIPNANIPSEHLTPLFHLVTRHTGDIGMQIRSFFPVLPENARLPREDPETQQGDRPTS